MNLTKTSPSWIYPRAKYDFDFANNRYWGGTIWLGSGDNNSQLAASILSEGNSGANDFSFFAPDTDGILKTFPQYAIRRTNYGVWIEGNVNANGTSDTNFALWCRDLTQTVWTKTTATAALNQVGADGTANSATLCTASSANATILQSIATLTSDTYIASAYIKRVTGTGTVFMTMDGSTYTDITSQLSTSKYTAITIASQTGTSANVGFKLATNGDAIAVDFFQLENNTVSTTPILTTSSTLFRGAEEIFYNGDGTSGVNNAGQKVIYDITSGHPATVLVQYSGKFSGNIHLLFGDSGANFALTGAVLGGALTVANTGSQTAVTSNTETLGLFNLNKVIGRFNGFSTGLSVCLNGGAIATGTGTFSPQASETNHGGHGNRGAGDQPLNGYISRVTMWPFEIPDGQMLKLSTVTNNI